jgi:glycosyltransferase involved in cell wall biosynthesis
VLPVVPNSGGFDLDRITYLQQSGPASSRRVIVVKGYQHWAGRALVALRAIALCAQELADYEIAVCLAPNDVKIAAEVLAHDTGLKVQIVPPCSHDEMLRLLGRARIYLGLSISDAISTSLLEAMVMGAFPIQSNTACADEWIIDGETGLLVPPEDPEIVATALRRALSDDAVVDHAALRNRCVARERLSVQVIQPRVVHMYRNLLTSFVSG